PYLDLINKGEVGTAELDDKARRVLRLIFRTAMAYDKGDGELCSEAHYDAARTIGANGIVLLRNEGGVLPIRTDGAKPRILVVGENAIKMMTVGGGSSSLKVQREVSPLDGIRAAASGIATVDYARGYVGDVTGEYNGVVTGQNLADSRSADELIAEACAKAAEADYVIFVGGLNKSAGQDCEDADRAGLELPYAQDAVIAALAKANPRTIVVNVSGNAVAMPWAKEVPAIVQAWFLGSEAGNSIADVLFGKVNPSGKLPMTFPVALADNGAHATGSYPGVKRADSPIFDLEYKEGILVGYRWHDTKKVKPLFAFGHGLSYTDFAYGDLKADSKEMNADGSITFRIPVTNKGGVAGAETVQLYISDPKCSVSRPAKELKGFCKVFLQPGETREVEFTVDASALSYFDADKHAWVAEPGQFLASAGASSADIRSTAKIVLK
ncbi:MAG: glycoside hydrolase family 3 C-terminal domain-containing protein, partial [Muribaculaceae bacterium]|nr:glycoside hydrolase family 3 C-terminal domain-containing protein [Muribaculaceae bacterium]